MAYSATEISSKPRSGVEKHVFLDPWGPVGRGGPGGVLEGSWASWKGSWGVLGGGLLGEEKGGRSWGSWRSGTSFPGGSESTKNATGLLKVSRPFFRRGRSINVWLSLGRALGPVPTASWGEVMDGRCHRCVWSGRSRPGPPGRQPRRGTTVRLKEVNKQHHRGGGG